MKKSAIVYNMFFAKALVKQGFQITNLDLNHADGKKVVFYFDDTPEFRTALKLLTRK